MTLRDGAKVAEIMGKVLVSIQSNAKLAGVFNKLMLDEDLYGHSARVCKLAAQLAIAYNLDNNVIFDVAMAGLLHDVGKLNTPKEILYKPAKLNDEEFEIMKKHPMDGYNMLKEVGVSDAVLNLVLKHHVNESKRSYPLQAAKTQLEEMITVADVYSALVEHRAYHNSMSKYDAMQIIETFEHMDKSMVAALDGVVED